MAARHACSVNPILHLSPNRPHTRDVIVKFSMKVAIRALRSPPTVNEAEEKRIYTGFDYFCIQFSQKVKSLWEEFGTK